MGIFVIFLILIVVFLVINKNKTRTEGPVLSKVDYRIFACGEEIFLKADAQSPIGKRKGLFAHSKSGSIVADGVPSRIDDILLSSFFEATGGRLNFSDEGEEIMRIPTEAGVREFNSGDLCNGKEARLHVLHYRVDTSTKPWSVYPRIMWKYFDYVLTNNYGNVPPGDCLIFIFDSEATLENSWPRCASYDKAIATGELILKK